MSTDLETFHAGYAEAFRSYLDGGGETGLESAYELGREAVTGGLSLLELAGVHHDVLAGCIEKAPPSDVDRVAHAGRSFFVESLSTFEMTQRGFREAQETARLEQLHAARLRGLADAALTLNSTLSVDEMLERLGEIACGLVGAENPTVHVAPGGGDGPGAPLRDRGRLAAPLVDRDGRPQGLIAVSGKREGEFTEDDESIIVQLAHLASVAIENARLYEQERGIAKTLQENLLPDRLPDIPTVKAWPAYEAGGDGDVGGDWYEVIELPGGRVGLAIGDVVGRGVRAAAMMGHLRMALRAYALETDSPALVAERMTRFARTLDGDQMCTCIYAVLDPASGRLCCANAGHPPPLVLTSDGRASFIAGRPGLPLGVSGRTEYAEAVVELEPGATLLLYTDGLVEKRGEAIDVGLERLRSVAAEAPLDPKALCKRVLDSLIEGTADDDVALLAVQTMPQDDSLDLTLPAEPRALGPLRRRLGAWLQHTGATRDESYDIVLATCEAAANAIEHAYGPGGAEFGVTARASGSDVVIDVHDGGAWRERREARRGRGLVVMRVVMDDVSVKSDDGGTNVRLRRRLERGRQRGGAGADPD
jgi:serine phosphatase RsbU (regulator of sigma subunit)/anti-sigma regulatory factor (Ser/Thr protein kinase)